MSLKKRTTEQFFNKINLSIFNCSTETFDLSQLKEWIDGKYKFYCLILIPEE